MKIEVSGYLSLHFGKEGFIGILPLSGGNGLNIKLNGFSCFWAFVDVGDNEFRVVTFPDEGRFKGWLKTQPRKVKIIQMQGLMGKEKKRGK